MTPGRTGQERAMRAGGTWLGRAFRTTAICAVFSAAFAVPLTSVEAQTYSFSSVSIEGNERIGDAAIISRAGIGAGAVSSAQLNDAYQRLVESGLFETVEIVPSGSTLRIRVVEYPTINRVSFEGNRRIDDEALIALTGSNERRVFNPAQAERDAATIAEAYASEGRLAAKVTPRIIRRSDNRVDLVFEIFEGGVVEIERLSFIGNRVYSDGRLRRVLGTKQAGIFRALVRRDTFVEEQIELDKQLLTDFYQSRGYVDFRVVSVNAQLAEERDGYFLAFNVQEGQQFRFGNVSVASEIPGLDGSRYGDIVKIKPGVVYTPTLIERDIARMERQAIRDGVDFLRVEPRITRNDRNLTLDVQYVLSKGPRVFVERIDIEGNTTTLDRVIRRQFTAVEGDPFNPREIREAAERIRALGYFEEAEVNAREGSAPDQVVVDVDVVEQPTGSLSVGGSYSTNDGFGIALSFAEENFLGRGQRLAVDLSTAEEARRYGLRFVEPALLGRNLEFSLNANVAQQRSSFTSYDADRFLFQPGIEFPVSENGRLQLRYSFESSEMLRRDDDDDPENGPIIQREIDRGRLDSSAIGYVYTYDTRFTGLNPNAGVLFEFGQDFAGIGGDDEFIKTTARLVGETRVWNEEVTLRATVEGGALNWKDGNSRAVNRFLLNPNIMRGFEPGGIGPRDLTVNDRDPLGGNLYVVARFEAEFPLGLPEEYGISGGLFYDVGNLWDLDNVDTRGGDVVGEDGSFRHVVGVSLFWNTPIGPLRFNLSNALQKEEFDREQSFDVTLSARF
ncbi:outer membrane protein assembly factor BamA [Sulfitobacter sp. D35]|uniref:outer membrane protein assembly factor BamA n=1 Tax=Sulfitobacter sp. D35 TaxID=3083252 RepID=UPI00296E2B45|nr:outer membrane protein assembly factor BamA [Sulfitobacter sp. D35]MDW4497737.1 outer membrane protein assembly factor BamA [Sulfitobacter sp. D35]